VVTELTLAQREMEFSVVAGAEATGLTQLTRPRREVCTLVRVVVVLRGLRVLGLSPEVVGALLVAVAQMVVLAETVI